MMAAFTAEDKAALAEDTPVGGLGTGKKLQSCWLFLAARMPDTSPWNRCSG